jgi:hypothetical protein
MILPELNDLKYLQTGAPTKNTSGMTFCETVKLGQRPESLEFNLTSN